MSFRKKYSFLFLLIIGFIGLAGGAWDLFQEFRLNRTGLIVTGSVIEKQARHSTRRLFVRLFGTYLTGEPAMHGITYSFEPEGGEHTEGEWTMPGDNFRSLRVGDAITIRYLQNSPTINKIDNVSRIIPNVIRIVFGCVSLALGVISIPRSPSKENVGESASSAP